MVLIKKILGFGLLFILSINPSSAEPTWVKGSNSYAVDGEIRLKRSNGLSVNANLNQLVPSRKSQGRTPNIMVVDSISGNYAWAYGFKMAGNKYYIYEEVLDIFIEFTQEQMKDLFDYDEEDYIAINLQNAGYWSSNASYSATFTCGNNDYTGSCSTRGSASGNGYGSSSLTGSFATGYSYRVDAFNNGVIGSFTVPFSFSDVFGVKVQKSHSVYSSQQGQCADTDGSGSTCSRTTQANMTLFLSQLFADDWNSSGYRVGFYRWTSANLNQGMYVIGDEVGQLPNVSFYLNESATQMAYLTGSNLNIVIPGEQPRVVMESAPSFPLSYVKINGVLNDLAPPP